MKKILAAVLSILLLPSLWACGGRVRDAETHEVTSEIYSAEDIDAATDTIKAEFRSHWKGCTLQEIYYAGDEVSQAHQEWAERKDAEETLVLLSSFDVDASGGDGSLNPNSRYTNWMWILVRSDGGQWIHVDHGY